MEDPTDEQLRPATGWGVENHVPNSRPTIIIVIDVRRAVEENWDNRQTRKGVRQERQEKVSSTVIRGYDCKKAKYFALIV